MDEFPQQEILGIIKARVKLSAPSTSEGSHLLAWLTVILEGKTQSGHVANRASNRYTSRKPLFFAYRLDILSQVNVTLFFFWRF